MLIGIDASRAFRSVRTGTERYSLEIIRHLLSAPAASVHQWRLYVDDAGIHASKAVRNEAVPNEGDTDVEYRHLPSRHMWTHRALGQEVVKHPPDVLFVPSHVIPMRMPSQLPPSVVTVHDVGYHYWPKMHTRQQRFHLELSTRWSVTAAERVICVSQATADDVRAIYGADPRELVVVHEGVTSLPRSSSSNTINLNLGFERPYACFIGTIQPRKNLARVLIAYAKLVDRHNIQWDLVLAGQPGWYSDELVTLTSQLALASRVHFSGYIPDTDIGPLLSNALFFCFPSLYEGFGLPVLEAQHMGVPVLTANNSSLPEVAGDAALLVDPTDVEAIADAMLKLSKDESLRQRLIAAGYENVKRFSWEKAAKETLAVLEEAADSDQADG